MAIPSASRTIARRLFIPDANLEKGLQAPDHRYVWHQTDGIQRDHRYVWRQRVGIRTLFGSHVGGREAAVDQECRAVDVARLVAREEQGRASDLASLREPAHRQVDAPPLVGARRLRGQPHPTWPLPR